MKDFGESSLGDRVCLKAQALVRVADGGGSRPGWGPPQGGKGVWLSSRFRMLASCSSQHLKP